MNELTPYEEWQLKVYGNILPEQTSYFTSEDFEQEDKGELWERLQQELELMDHF